MKRVMIIIVAVVIALVWVISAFAQYGGPRGGIAGIVLGRENGTIVALKVKPGMGAFRAGIVEGDVIVAIDGMPVAGKSIDEVRRLLSGGVGTDVNITIRDGAGDERAVPVVRQPLIEPANPGLPVHMGLPKPHDLRPEDGMVCTIASVSGRTAVINCGENAGVDTRQPVSFIHRSDYAKHRDIATGSVTKVHDNTATVAVSGNAAELQSDDVVAVTAAWRSERARENTLWRVTAHGINLLDYPTHLPYATIDELRFDTDLKLEQAAVTKMVQRLQEAADVVHDVYSGKVGKGRFHGKSLAGAFKGTTPQDMMAFLKYLITYPDNFIGRDWSLPEVYATWILNGTPH